MSEVDISDAEVSNGDWTDVSSDESFDIDERGDNVHQCMYGNEPEYTADELRKLDELVMFVS